MDNWSTSSIVVNSLEASPRIEDWFRESSITSAQASINLYGPELPLLSEGFSVQNTVKTFLSSWECKQVNHTLIMLNMGGHYPVTQQESLLALSHY
jgi:hypothetical protein